VDLVQAQATGIVGVIHKATQGTGYHDPMYQTNRAKAQAAELLWGAYHFGVGADGVQQADHFLQVVQPGPQDLVVLDFETNPVGPTMTLEEARAFVTHINEPWAGFPDSIPGTTSSRRLVRAPTRCWPNAGFGWRNIPPRPLCRSTGRPGPCGNTPTAVTGILLMRFLASAAATATNLMAIWTR
jgi:Glycosyl hydrolases family 25